MGRPEYELVKKLQVPAESSSRLWLVATVAADSQLETFCRSLGNLECTSADLLENGLVSFAEATKDRKFTKLERLQLSAPEIFVYENREKPYEFPLTAMVLQKYEGRESEKKESKATVVSFEFQLNNKTVEEWLTNASLLLHVGGKSIAAQIKQQSGVSPQRLSVMSFLHVWGEIEEAGLLDAAEVLCAGLPGDAPFDEPLGRRTDGVPPGVLRRSENWFYYASNRRVGCVVANKKSPKVANEKSLKEPDDYRNQFFPGKFKTEFLGTFGFAAIESHFLSRYGDDLLELGPLKSSGSVVSKLRSMNKAMLSLRVDLGSGQVSDRHGIQVWYKHVSDGLQIDDRFNRFRDSLLSLLEIRQAEMQAKVENSQTVLTTLGLFVAGAFAYTTIRDSLLAEETILPGEPTVASQAVPVWMELGITTAPWNVFVPMLFWGTSAVLVKQLVAFTVKRLKN